MRRFLREISNFNPFTEDEAWLLFKLAAFAETAGWSLLISGLLIKHFITPRSDIPVLITGQIHGTFFLIYMSASLILSPSLGWSIKRSLLATACGVPPYGSLIFEIATAHKRAHNQLRVLAALNHYRQLSGRLAPLGH